MCDIKVYCESLELSLTIQVDDFENTNTHWVDGCVKNKEIFDDFHISAGDYDDFCIQEVEVWERGLEEHEIAELHVFPYWLTSEGECNRPCGPGLAIQAMSGCSSFHWGCDHLTPLVSEPIECIQGTCQELSSQTGFQTTNGEIINSDDCVT